MSRVALRESQALNGRSYPRTWPPTCVGCRHTELPPPQMRLANGLVCRRKSLGNNSCALPVCPTVWWVVSVKTIAAAGYDVEVLVGALS